MSSYNTRHKETMEDIIGEKSLEKLQYMGLTEERLASLYHNEFNRSQKEFQQAVKKMLDDEEVKNLDRQIKNEIQDKTEMIEKLQQIRQSLTIQEIKKHRGNN